MNIHTTSRARLLACGLLALGSSLAQADTQTTTQTLMPAMGDKPFSTTITSTRKNAQRVETTMSVAGAEQRTVTLTLCDKKVTYTLDPSLKIYYSTSLVMPVAEDKEPAKSNAKRTTGKITTTLLGVKDLGERAIGAYKTRGYEITTRTQTSGCLGASDTTTKQEIWTAPAEGQGGDEFACGEASAVGGGGDACDASMERKGDKALWARYNKLMSGLRVSTKMSLGEDAKDATSETRLVKVSRAKLPDSLFAIPAGFRLLSAKEFQAEQSKAMMQKMMQQGGQGDDDEAEEDKEEEDATEAEATDEE